MTKQRVLSDNQIKTLVTLYVNYKKAEAEFNEAKKILTANLECGKYESDFGSVTKQESVSMILNKDRLAFEHPEINLNEYKEPVVVTKIIVKNLNLA